MSESDKIMPHQPKQTHFSVLERYTSWLRQAICPCFIETLSILTHWTITSGNRNRWPWLISWLY